MVSTVRGKTADLTILQQKNTQEGEGHNRVRVIKHWGKLGVSDWVKSNPIKTESMSPANNDFSVPSSSPK